MGKHINRRALIPMEQRFWAKVDTTGGCWEWTGVTNGAGYGKIALPGRSIMMLAHRYSAMLHYGMFDTRLLVLHHCDNPSCVRPEHLYLGDSKQNMQDKMQRSRHVGANKTHCVHGHRYTDDNTYRYQGKRICKECNRNRAQERRSTTTGGTG
jgi:hypothetical protein